uniref:Uncharacterized protein n=1 Tax=Nelumbo nucifera TaxID=4432 RepID=A0A822ZA73_NELNU|nr:TPA_asm: hypothetical protein HUJ06_014904 [Nelumbo nucifera]
MQPILREPCVMTDEWPCLLRAYSSNILRLDTYSRLPNLIWRIYIGKSSIAPPAPRGGE